MSRDQAAQSRTPGGWDPYEVWRTRVLLPRLNEARPETEVADEPGREAGQARRQSA